MRFRNRGCLALPSHGRFRSWVGQVLGAQQFGELVRRDQLALQDEFRLPDALTELATEHARDRMGDPPDVEILGHPRPIRAAVEVALTGAVREAFVNAARHAPGAALSAVLEFRPDAVSVIIHNGHPTRPPATDSTPGHGLTGMREQLALVGGRLTAGPDGSGWTVAAEVPEA